MTITNGTPTISPVKQIEALSQRLEKARSIYADGKVHPIVGMEDHYAVESSKSDGFYLVNGLCTCLDAQQRVDVHHGWCKHKLSVELFKEILGKETPKAKAGPETAAAPPETDRPLEDLLEDMYPKGRPSDSLR